MIRLSELKQFLQEQPAKNVEIRLPDGSMVPAHFHVTEVGRVKKDFIDCGGTIRSTEACVLQAWVAHDINHRLSTTKLAKILAMAEPLLQGTDLPVEIEYEAGAISQYPLMSIDQSESGLLLQLVTKHTACLAEDRCRIPSLPVSLGPCCEPGCC